MTNQSITMLSKHTDYKINIQRFTESLFKHIRSQCDTVKIELNSFSVISIRRLHRTRSLAIISYGDVLS